MAANRILALLIVAAAILFAIGAGLEKSDSHVEGGTEPAAHVESGEALEEGGSEAGEVHVESSSENAGSDEGETLLGVDLESTPLIVLAVLLPLGLAAAVWLRPDVAALLLLVAAAMLIFASLDIREVVHQLDESNTDIAVIAAVVALLHGAAAVLAVSLLRQRPNAPDR